MYVLLCYDIASNRNRARFHKYLKEFGLNTQKSVFECDLEDQALKQIIRTATQLLDQETDSFLIYGACRRCQKKVAVSGLGIKLIPLDFQII